MRAAATAARRRGGVVGSERAHRLLGQVDELQERRPEAYAPIYKGRERRFKNGTGADGAAVGMIRDWRGRHVAGSAGAKSNREREEREAAEARQWARHGALPSKDAAARAKLRRKALCNARAKEGVFDIASDTPSASSSSSSSSEESSSSSSSSSASSNSDSESSSSSSDENWRRRSRGGRRKLATDDAVRHRRDGKKSNSEVRHKSSSSSSSNSNRRRKSSSGNASSKRSDGGKNSSSSGRSKRKTSGGGPRQHGSARKASRAASGDSGGSSLAAAEAIIKIGPFKPTTSLHRRLHRVISQVEPDNLGRVGKLVEKVQRGALTLRQVEEYMMQTYSVDVHLR